VPGFSSSAVCNIILLFASFDLSIWLKYFRNYFHNEGISRAVSCEAVPQMVQGFVFNGILKNSTQHSEYNIVSDI